MKVLLHPAFLLCLLGFLTNQLLEKNGIFIPFIHAYADDVYAMPVLLSLSSTGMSLVYFGKSSLKFVYRLSFYQVIFALLYCSVLFEFVLPRFSSTYVSDYLDLAAYTFGAALYYRFINPARLVKSATIS